MTQNNPNTQTTSGKPSWMQDDNPYYLPFSFAQIKQSSSGVSSVGEAQDEFVAQAGMPKALPDEQTSKNALTRK